MTAPRRRRRSKDPDLQISAFPVDPEQAALATVLYVAQLNSHAIPLGVIFTHTMRDFDVRDIIAGSGAGDLAEQHDQGPVGQYLRLLRKAGFFSRSIPVREALAQRLQVQRTRQIMAKAVDEPAKRSVRHIVDGAEAVLYHCIAPMVEHRGIWIKAPNDEG